MDFNVIVCFNIFNDAFQHLFAMRIAVSAGADADDALVDRIEGADFRDGNVVFVMHFMNDAFDDASFVFQGLRVKNQE